MASSTHTTTYTLDAKTAKFVRGMGMAAGAITQLNATMTKTRTVTSNQSGFSGFTNGLNRLVSGVEKAGTFVVNKFMDMANAVRLTAQGFMTAGKALTFALTPAALLVLGGAAKAAIDFDDALVRVSKTTGLTGKRLGDVARGIRDLAMTTSTGTVELAKLAEQIGQTGVRDPKGIVELTELFNKLVVTTDVTADEVALQMGRIAKAFGMDLNTEEGRDQIMRLANVFNELENRMEVTVPEIIEGMLNLAEVGSMLDFPPTVGAALVSSLTALGMSAQEAGTALRNLLMKVVQEADVVADLMANTWGAVSAQDVLNRMNEDAAEVILELIKAASMGDEKAQALFATMEVGGIRGGKGWAALAAGIETTTKALGISEEEWAKATSLQIEYERALLSTKSQLQVMKNNLTEVAIELGQVMLPIINEAIQTIIPAIRELAVAIKNMSAQQVISIVKWIAIAAAIGPALLVVSQLVFTLSMLAMAFGKVMSFAWSFAVIGMKLIVMLIQLGGLFGKLRIGIGLIATKALPALLSGLMGIASAVFSVQGAIVALAAAGLYLLLKFSGLGEKIANFFLDLASRAESWGENLMNTFAGGMLAAAARVLAKVLTWIGNFIGRFFAGHSPPEIGPLSHIDRWGKTLIDTYLGGMLEGDFSILDRVSGIIGSILSNFAKTDLVGEKDQFKMLLQARQDLAKLLSTFQKTGKVSEGVLKDVVKNLGEAKDEVAELLRRWIKYVDIQKQLEELERRRQGVLDTYDDEIELIGASNKSAEERVSLIRNAMRGRDRELKTIAQKEQVLKKEEVTAKSQLDLQRELIEAMQKQDDIQAQLLEKIKQMTGSLSEGLEFPEISMPPFPEIDPEDMVGQLDERFLTLEERIKEAGRVWEAFKRGFLGQPIGEDLIPFGEPTDEQRRNALITGQDPNLMVPDQGKLQTAFEQGKKLGDVWTTISTTLGQVRDKFSELIGSMNFQGIIDAIGNLKNALLGTGEEAEKSLTPPSENAWSKFAKGFSDNFEDARKEIADFLNLDFGDFKKRFGDMWKFFLTSWGFVQEILKIARGIFNKLLTWLGIDVQLGEWQMTWEEFGAHVANAVAWILNILLAVVGGIVSFVGAIVGFAVWLAGLIVSILITLGTLIVVAIAGLIGGIIKFIEWLPTGIGLAIEWVKKLGGKIKEWAEELGPKLSTWFSEAGRTIGEKLEEWVGIAGEKLTTFKENVATKFEEIKTNINTTVDNIKNIIGEKFEEAKTKMETAIENARKAVATKFEEIKTNVRTKFEEIKNLIDPDALFQRGKDLVQGFWDGMRGRIADAISWLTGKINEILSLFGKIPQSESPSKVTTKFGKYVGEGFNMGIQEELSMTPGVITDALGLSMGAFAPETPEFLESNVATIQQPMTLIFERDSVRSEDDIDEIADRVTEIMYRKGVSYMNYGGGR